MRSFLLFALMSLLANFMWCGKKEEPAIPAGTVYDGYWNITDLQTKRFTRNNQLSWETKEVFKMGERAFEFGPEDYREFENGYLSRLGNYTLEGRQVILMADGDTLYSEVVNNSENTLFLHQIERDCLGYEIKQINAQK